MKELFKALAAFQQECPVIHKDTEGYGYSYADLPAIFEVINPLLKKHGLGFTQLLDSENLKTIVFHIESGEIIESSVHIEQGVTLAKMNPFQVLGSAITYYRRYSLSAALGLITDKDTDASGEVTNPVNKQEDDKLWLNPDTEPFLKAIQYLKDGGEIKDIFKKYKVSKKNQELLIEKSK